MMTMHLLDRLLRPLARPASVPDPLRDQVEQARAASADAWEAINRRRVQRGERPLAPAWEDLTGPGVTEDGAHGPE
jgi:hypothetical protein